MIKRKKKGKIVKCENCGQRHYKKPYELKRVKRYFCSRKCSGIASRGRESSHKGKKLPPLSDKAKKKISRALKGKKYNRVKPPWNKGKRCPQLEGKNNPSWKGGKTALSLRIRHCFKYRQWRSDVFTRDNFTCQFCGLRGCYLEADHYPKLFSEILEEYNIKTLEEALVCEELWNINGGRTLCKECHNLTKTGKKAKKL